MTPSDLSATTQHTNSEPITRRLPDPCPSAAELHDRLRQVTAVLGRPLRIGHIVPARVSLDLLMAHRLRMMAEFGIKNVGISGDADWVTNHDGQPFDFLPLKFFTRRMDPLSDFRAFMEMLRILRREQFDVVTTYGPKPGAFGRIAAWLSGVPFIVHVNWGLLFTDHSPAWRKWAVLAVEAFSSQFGDRVLSVNPDDIYYLAKLESMKCARPFRRHSVKVGYLGNACDLSSFDPDMVRPETVLEKRRCWGVLPSDIVVGMVGRLVAEKGCLEFVRAAAELAHRNCNCRLVLIGPTDSNKKDFIEQSWARRFVILPGYEEDMPSAYAAMDIVVLPSHREGFPRTLVEACAMGKPIITTDTRGCREAVREGQNGTLIPVSDYKALAGAIQRFADDPGLRERAGKRSREIALAEFDDRVLVRRMLGVYLEGLERSFSTARPAFADNRPS